MPCGFCAMRDIVQTDFPEGQKGKDLVGRGLQVKFDKRWYMGEIVDFSSQGYHVKYEDATDEWLADVYGDADIMLLNQVTHAQFVELAKRGISWDANKQVWNTRVIAGGRSFFVGKFPLVADAIAAHQVALSDMKLQSRTRPRRARSDSSATGAPLSPTRARRRKAAETSAAEDPADGEPVASASSTVDSNGSSALRSDAMKLEPPAPPAPSTKETTKSSPPKVKAEELSLPSAATPTSPTKARRRRDRERGRPGRRQRAADFARKQEEMLRQYAAARQNRKEEQKKEVTGPETSKARSPVAARIEAAAQRASEISSGEQARGDAPASSPEQETSAETNVRPAAKRKVAEVGSSAEVPEKSALSPKNRAESDKGSSEGMARATKAPEATSPKRKRARDGRRGRRGRRFADADNVDDDSEEDEAERTVEASSNDAQGQGSGIDVESGFMDPQFIAMQRQMLERLQRSNRKSLRREDRQRGKASKPVKVKNKVSKSSKANDEAVDARDEGPKSAPAVKTEKKDKAAKKAAKKKKKKRERERLAAKESSAVPKAGNENTHVPAPAQLVIVAPFMRPLGPTKKRSSFVDRLNLLSVCDHLPHFFPLKKRFRYLEDLQRNDASSQGQAENSTSSAPNAIH